MNIYKILKYRPFSELFRRYSSLYPKPFMHYLMNLPQTCVNTLDNGLTVATLERETQTSSITLLIDGGSRYETKQENGLTHLMEHLAFKGTEDILNSRGAQVKCQAGREVVTLSVECHNKDVRDFIAIILQTTFNNPLSPDEICKQINIISQEMCQYESDYYNLTMDYLHSSAFQGTFLGQSVMGRSENVCNFNQTILKTYLDRIWQPRRAVLTIVGGLEHKTIVNFAEESTKDIISHKYDEKDYYRYTGSEAKFRDDSLPAAHIAIAVEAPPMWHDDFLVMELAKNHIGGWHCSQGLSSNHVNELSAAASYYTQGYKSFNICYKDTGLWGLHFVATPLKQDDMFYNIYAILMKMCTCISEKQVERAKYEMKSKLLYKTEKNTGIGLFIGLSILYTGIPLNIYDVINEIDNISAKDVKEVGMKYIYDRCPVVAAVGPCEGMPDYTRIRAGFYWLRF